VLTIANKPNGIIPSTRPQEFTMRRKPVENFISDSNLEKLKQLAIAQIFTRTGWKEIKTAKGKYRSFDTEIRGSNALIIAKLCEEIQRLRALSAKSGPSAVQRAVTAGARFTKGRH
jgi:hypothetical protein